MGSISISLAKRGKQRTTIWSPKYLSYSCDRRYLLSFSQEIGACSFRSCPRISLMKSPSLTFLVSMTFFTNPAPSRTRSHPCIVSPMELKSYSRINCFASLLSYFRYHFKILRIPFFLSTISIVLDIS